MDYEKAYKDALKRAKKLYEQGTITESLSYVFPELKESEDERIRKEIIDFLWKEKIFLQEVHLSVENSPKYRFVMDAIAWLEKQAPKTKWSEEDSKVIDNCCLLVAAADDSYEKAFKDDCIHYLQNLKQRMGV